jgi:hypothetical protein
MDPDQGEREKREPDEEHWSEVSHVVYERDASSVCREWGDEVGHCAHQQGESHEALARSPPWQERKYSSTERHDQHDRPGGSERAGQTGKVVAVPD